MKLNVGQNCKCFKFHILMPTDYTKDAFDFMEMIVNSAEFVLLISVAGKRYIKWFQDGLEYSFFKKMTYFH